MGDNVSLVGSDTVIIDKITLKNFADDDTAKLTFPNKLVEASVGKNGNAIFNFNASGRLVNVELRLLLGSTDDRRLNTRMKQFINDPAAFVLFKAEFIKRVGDGAGGVINNVYTMSNGVIDNMVDAKENVGGDKEAAVALYKFTFTNTNRSMG